jgi:general secretion pathway protein A
MYLRYFNLNEVPFSITPDPAFVFLSPRHRDALAHLLYGIGKGGSGGFVQLTGEVGTGKTTLCRCLLEQVPDGTRIALVLNPLVTPQELLADISEELGIDVSETMLSTRLLVDGLTRFLLKAHEKGERVVVVIDEAQNLSPEALEQVRLLTNLETSKEKLLQIVLLGQPELRELLQRRDLRQLAQRITARYHLAPLGLKETHLYVRHRMQVAGAQRNPFKRRAMNALYQRSQGIPRLINIIADRALVAAFAQEKLEVSSAMVHAAANEVQLGERQVRRLNWPWLAGAAAVLVAIATFSYVYWDRHNVEAPSRSLAQQDTANFEPVATQELNQPANTVEGLVEEVPMQENLDPEPSTALSTELVQPLAEPAIQELTEQWLNAHQTRVWQDMANVWLDNNAATAIQKACDGENSSGYVCLRDQGSWSKIKRLDLPVILILQGSLPSYVLLRGMGDGRLLLGGDADSLTVNQDQVDNKWLGAYMVAWPQAKDWPAEVKRGDEGVAVATIMQMAQRVENPYRGGPVFGETFETWLKDFQARNGLNPDGIVGRNTLLHLMTASIEEPKLLQAWEY